MLFGNCKISTNGLKKWLVKYDDGDTLWENESSLNVETEVDEFPLINGSTCNWVKTWAKCCVAGWTSKNMPSRGKIYFRPGKQKSSLAVFSPNNLKITNLKISQRNIDWFDDPIDVLSNFTEKEKIRFIERKK